MRAISKQAWLLTLAQFVMMLILALGARVSWSTGETTAMGLFIFGAIAMALLTAYAFVHALSCSSRSAHGQPAIPAHWHTPPPAHTPTPEPPPEPEAPPERTHARDRRVGTSTQEAAQVHRGYDHQDTGMYVTIAWLALLLFLLYALVAGLFKADLDIVIDIVALVFLPATLAVALSVVTKRRRTFESGRLQSVAKAQRARQSQR